MNSKEEKIIKSIKSDSIRLMAIHLIKSGVRITFYGQAWSKDPSDWIYFDTILDIDNLKKGFKLSKHIIIHENLDPKSGTEKGFIDTKTGEGLMGKLH